MTDKPAPEEIALWQRRLASQANNRAWTLAEMPHRSPGEDEEMLQAAHAAMYFWKIVGNADHHAHAAQLLAHAYALMKLPVPAAKYLERSLPYFLERNGPPSERAFAHAVAANVALAEGNGEAHRSHHSQAMGLALQVVDPRERERLDATLRVVPGPVT